MYTYTPRISKRITGFKQPHICPYFTSVDIWNKNWRYFNKRLRINEDITLKQRREVHYLTPSNCVKINSNLTVCRNACNFVWAWPNSPIVHNMFVEKFFKNGATENERVLNSHCKELTEIEKTSRKGFRNKSKEQCKYWTINERKRRKRFYVLYKLHHHAKGLLGS